MIQLINLAYLLYLLSSPMQPVEHEHGRELADSYILQPSMVESLRRRNFDLDSLPTPRTQYSGNTLMVMYEFEGRSIVLLVHPDETIEMSLWPADRE